jgi:hypothetical protein
MQPLCFMYARNLVSRSKGRNHFEDLDLEGRIILEYTVVCRPAVDNDREISNYTTAAAKYWSRIQQ